MKRDKATSENFLRDILNNYHSISDIGFQKILSICNYKEAKKGFQLDVIGERSKHFYFLIEGLVRSYTVTPDGKEVIKIFFDKGGFPGNIVSKLNDSDNTFTIEALEDIIYYEIDFNAFRELINSDFEIAKFHIAYIEENWIKGKETLDISLRSDDAAIRYKQFVQQYPKVYSRVSLGHIASYLGVSQTQLSRIRKKI